MGLFLTGTVQPPCSPQYIRCERGAEFQLNAVPVVWENSKALIYFPRPFLILGLVKEPLPDVPPAHAGNPYFSMSNAQFETPANQNTYKDITTTLMLDLAYANMFPVNDPVTQMWFWPVQYLRPGIQATDYRGYFTKFLNPLITPLEPRQWLNSFIQPASRFWQFATDNAADTAPVWNQKFYDFLQFIGKNSDQRLFGAPGVYSIDNIPASPFQNEWTLNIDYETFQEL